MAATASLYPTTATPSTATGTTWTNPNNATGSGTGTTSASWAVWTSTTPSVTATLQLSGYAAQAAIGQQPVSIDSVAVTVTHHESSTATTVVTALTAQLYSGASTAIGTAQSLTRSTSTSFSQTITFTGANAPTWAQLADLRVMISGTRANSATSYTVNVDAAAVVVNYSLLVASTGAGVTTSTVATGTLTTTTALTPAVGDVVIVKASSGAYQLEPTGVPTASAGGITFTQALAANTASTTATPLYIWGGTVTTAAAFTVSLPYQLTASFTVSLAMTVEVHRNVALPATPNATATTAGDNTAPFTNTLTTATPNSLVSWLAGDYSGTYNSSAPPTVTPYAGSITYDFFSSTANVLDHYSGVQSAPTPGAQTYGYTAPTSTAQSVTYAALELPLPNRISSLVTDFSAVPSFFDGNFGGAFIDGNYQGETPTINAYSAFKTAEYYSLLNDSVYCQVVSASGTSGSRQNSIKCIIDANNSVEMMLGGGVFTGRVQVAGTNTDTTLATYSATTHAWWRIREAAGVVYWDTSPDGTTWTNLGSRTHGLNLTAVQLSLQAGYWNAAEPGLPAPNAIYDNLNMVPAAPISWAGDFAQADVVAAGFQDDNWNRDDGAGGTGTMAWPMPIAVAPDGIRSAQVTLPSGGKRDEIVEGHRDFAAGDNLWCGSSFYLPTGFDTTASAGSQFQVIEQLRQADDTGSPVAAFEVRGGNLLLTGGYGILGASPASQYQYSQTLVTGITTGVRHYMTYRVGPFSTTAGASTIDFYVDGTHVLTAFTIPPPTLIGGTTYHKQGWYRDPANTYAGTLYISHSKVGATQAAVDSTPSGTAYSQTVTDAAGAVDAATPATTYPRTVTDAAGAVDAATPATTYARAVADAAGTVDAAGQASNYARNTADTAGAVDATQTVSADAAALTDAATASDAVTSTLTATRTLADAAAASDAGSGGTPLGTGPLGAGPLGGAANPTATLSPTGVSYTRSPADAAATTDGVSAVLAYGTTFADAAAAVDTAAVVASYARPVADVAGAADAVQVAAADATQVAETAPAADAITTAATYARSPADSAGVADAVASSVTKAVADTAPATDAAAAAATYLPGAADTVDTVDATSTALDYAQSPADAVPAADATSTALDYAQAPADTAVAADAVATTAAYSLPIADTADAADAVQVSGAGGAQVVDATPVVDAADTAADYSRGVADVAGDDDAVTAELTKSLIDTAAAVGVVVANIDYAAAVSDVAATEDNADSAATYGGIVADGAAVTDAAQAAGAGSAQVPDTAAATDVVMVSVAAMQVLDDAAAVVDAVDAEHSFGDSSITLADAVDVDDIATSFVTAGQPGAFFAFLGGLM